MTTYTEFEAKLLVAAYLTSESLGKDFVDVREILAHHHLEARPNWIRRALSSFQDMGLSRGKMHMGAEEDQHVYLSAEGVKEAERLIAQGLSVESTQSRPHGALLTDEASAEMVPASDRLVPLDHNSASYRDIATSLDELYNEVRTANDLDCEPDERERLVASMAAARTLWDAAQLKIVQIKVGVIIAVQDTVDALTRVGKAVGKGMLVDAIKAFVKTVTGIDI